MSPATGFPAHERAPRRSDPQADRGVGRNVLANYAGSVAVALTSVLLVPLYIHFLGIEAFGLVGVYVTLQGILPMLDLGLSSTLNREMARLAVRADSRVQMRELLRTCEWILWPGAVTLCAALVAFAPAAASGWLNEQSLSAESTRRAVALLGCVAALEWPFALYAGGLLGLQRQVLLNTILVGTTLFRGVGSVLVLWLVSPTIEAFFLWQLLGAALQTSCAALLLWRGIPELERPARFRLDALRGVWRFAAGMTGITVLAGALTQMDKIAVMRILPLEMFGYYTLAATVAAGLYRVTSPLFAALYPRFTELVVRDEPAALRRTYHAGCQAMSVAVLPLTLVLCLFSREVLVVWTGDSAMAERTAGVLSLLILGTALNALMTLPFALQLAHGWTRLALRTNLASLAVLLPLSFYATHRYGMAGAAIGWALLNAGYVVVVAPLMHRRLLRRDLWHWYGTDIALPLGSASLVTAVSRWLMPHGVSSPAAVAWLLGTGLMALAAAALATPTPRAWLLGRIGRRLRVGLAPAN